MTQYDNNMRGALFKNDRKEKDTHPDYKGQCEINGVEHWVSAWLKDKKDGGKFLSLSFQVKEQQLAVSNSNGGHAQHNAGQVDDFNDDVPFAPINDKLIGF